MARKGNIEELIHCDACGEDYSATYRRCPFCGEKPGVRPPVSSVEDDEDDGYVFDGQALFDEPQETRHTRAGKGGKRLAERSSARKRSKASSAGKGGHYDPPGPINWVRLTTFIFSLVIIIAALIIVFTVFYPKLHRNPNPAPSPSPSASQPVSPEPSDPNADPTGGPSGEPSGEPSADPNALTGLAFGRPNDYDFTLRSGESHTISLVFDPEGWEGTVTWATSDANFATVDANGKVTNVNQTSSLRRVIITATAGGQSVEAIVYCRAADSSPTAPPVVTSPDPDPSTPSSGTLTPGTTGVITGADGGLRVRSGPGTGYSVQASLVNGNKVTVEEDAGDGWYKISYSGSGGVTYTGYIMGEYISPSN